jgi:hypothetical protein
MKRVLGIIGGLVVLCGVLGAAIFGLVMFLTQGVATNGDAFMLAVQEDRFEDAYALFTVSLQDEVSLNDFEETFDPMTLESWNFSSRNIENNIGSVSGTAVIDGGTYVVTIGFVNAEDQWLINSYNFVEATGE